MKRKTVLLTAACALLIAGNVAAEEGGLYVSGKIGATIPSDADANDPTLAAANINATFEMDTGYSSAFAVGTKVAGDALRLEAEIGYQNSDTDKLVLTSGAVTVAASMTGEMSILSGMANFYYDFPASDSSIKPYIMAGVGMAKVSVDDVTATLGGTTITFSNEDDNVVAAQVGAGLGIPIANQLTLDIEYRYFFSQDADFDGTEVEIGSHNIYAGLRYTF